MRCTTLVDHSSLGCSDGSGDASRGCFGWGGGWVWFVIRLESFVYGVHLGRGEL